MQPRTHDAVRRRGKAHEAGGFSLIEVIVAATVLLVGMLGVAQLLNVANRSTSLTAARTNATSVARQAVETARGVNPRNLVPASLYSELVGATPELADVDPKDTAWTIEREGVTFTLTASVCTVDDPSDGIGAAGTHGAGYCATPTPTTPADAQPADNQQVTAVVAWGGERAGSVKQVTAVPVGSNAAVPGVSALQMTSPSSCTTSCPAITSTATTSARFALATVNNPASITWLLQGSPMATCPPNTAGCSGSGNAWGFTWNLGTPAKDTTTGSATYGMCLPGSYTYDGAYEVGARAQDAAGLSGAPGSLSIELNRCPALSPPNFAATDREKTTALIDTQWDSNPEGDIIGYRVYRGTSTTSRTRVCPATVTAVIPLDAATTCTDTAPPAYAKSPYYYAVYAVDRDPVTGALREGALAFQDVNTGNRAPSAPTTLTAASAGTTKTITWRLPATTPFDADSGDRIDTFRIYRRAGTTTAAPVLGDRYDREVLSAVCPSSTAGATCTYVDTTPGTGPYTYWVTAVDTNVRESTTLGPRTA